jgi:hypothetical protein
MESVLPVATTKKGKNVRLDLAHALVEAQITKKVAYHASRREQERIQAEQSYSAYHEALARGDESVCHQWSRPPRVPADVVAMYDRWIEREHKYYALVRVIELPQNGDRFLLVYGDEEDATVTQGTGPFESFEKAAAWFMNGGR